MSGNVFSKRRAGVLLHPTSLPGSGDAGTFGDDAWRFVDFLSDGGFSVWQTLPLGPVDSYGSPYGLRSAVAGELCLIDENRLTELDLLPGRMALECIRVDMHEAYRSFYMSASAGQKRGFSEFFKRNRQWLLPYGLFELCRWRTKGQPWWEWLREWRYKNPAALRKLLASERDRFRSVAFGQYVFDLQWRALKQYANSRGIKLFGDLPFYMALNSADVWWEPTLFQLDANSKPIAVAGVPPDYFNAEGQLWGNPLYDWDAMQATGFDWWLRRLRVQLERFDLLRLDHFRALASYWEIPAEATSARHGRWCRGYGEPLLSAVRDMLGPIPLVAEDLGQITPDVVALRNRFELPGMAVLQFAFDSKDDNPHLPRNQRHCSVCYTGTHDNDTTLGWYQTLDERSRHQMASELGLRQCRMPDDLIGAAYASPAQLAIMPMQDLLGLGSAARMNLPGTTCDNWKWRFSWDDVDPSTAVTARERALRHNRLVGSAEQ